MTSPPRSQPGDARPTCKICGLEDGACICAHLRPAASDGAREALDLIDKRLVDLRAANDIFRKHSWDRSSDIQRNDREIRWLIDFRTLLRAPAQCGVQNEPVAWRFWDGIEWHLTHSRPNLGSWRKVEPLFTCPLPSAEGK